MKVLVCGDRNWNNYWAIYDVLHRLDRSSVIIHGAARGADTMAGVIAKNLGFAEIVAVPADWEQYGRAAGPIRNKKMLDMDPDLVLAFHSDIQNSKGTLNMVTIAKKKGVEVRIYESKTRDLPTKRDSL